MTVYSGPVFDMAVNQFGVIANHLEIPIDERDRILMPKRSVTISCPIHRDDGTVDPLLGLSCLHGFALHGGYSRTQRREPTIWMMVMTRTSSIMITLTAAA